MYTANLGNLLDYLEKDLPTWKSTIKTVASEYDVKKLEDGKQELTISVLGHNPKDIKLEVTEDNITIKSSKPENSSSLVNDIDLSFTLSKDYDGTKTEAKFSNGLLVLTIDKKNERKSKIVKISY
jgi:HSP20 family molecular chaperone IbpA